MAFSLCLSLTTAASEGLEDARYDEHTWRLGLYYLGGVVGRVTHSYVGGAAAKHWRAQHVWIVQHTHYYGALCSVWTAAPATGRMVRAVYYGAYSGYSIKAAATAREATPTSISETTRCRQACSLFAAQVWMYFGTAQSAREYIVAVSTPYSVHAGTYY